MPQLDLYLINIQIFEFLFSFFGGYLILYFTNLYLIYNTKFNKIFLKKKLLILNKTVFQFKIFQINLDILLINGILGITNFDLFNNFYSRYIRFSSFLLQINSLSIFSQNNNLNTNFLLLNKEIL